MNQEANITEAQEFKKNPRKITNDKLVYLENSMEELGDISGIIHCLNSDEIIGGNQRTKIFKHRQAQTIITERFEEPTIQGTVAWGYIELFEERFSYRQVRWTEEQRKQANLRANKNAGLWDEEKLKEWFSELELLEAGFNETELPNFDMSDFEDNDESEDQETEETNGFKVKYEIIFDSEEQKENWDKFLIALKKKYPEKETIAARIDEHIADFQNPLI